MWADRRVLVTGHTGFKGAWLIRWLRALGADVTGVALAPEHRDGIHAALEPWDIRSALVDIRDPQALAGVVGEVGPDVVFHLAAQSLVRRGYEQPSLTYEVNVVGTANVLAAVGSSVQAVVVVTSDKVYRQDGTGRRFREDDALGGGDPYSASKACAELVVAEWAQRHGVPVATARAGNVIGGGDRAEDRLLPDLVRSAESGTPARIRNPGATRPWQHVLDPLAGYLQLAEHLLGDGAPPAVNFGPDETATVDDVTARFGLGTHLLDEDDHPREATAIALDSSLAASSLGWRPRLSLDDALAWTAEWYRAQMNGEDLAALTDAQIARFEALA